MNVTQDGLAEQRTDQWLMDRMGRLTASILYKATARTKKGEYYSGREEVMSDLMAERISLSIMPTFKSPAMQWGIDKEPVARDAYSIHTGNTVVETGFIKHPTIKWFGASPDGLVNDDGGLEIKCPHTSEHLRNITTEEIKDEYIAQMYAGMLCTGRKWWDFVSFDPRIGGDLALWVCRIELQDQLADYYLEEAEKFTTELDQRCRNLLVKYPKTLEIYETNWSE